MIIDKIKSVCKAHSADKNTIYQNVISTAKDAEHKRDGLKKLRTISALCIVVIIVAAGGIS